MTDSPQIDLAAETSIAGYEIALIALAVALALAFLFRGMLRRRRGAAPGCAGCGGCTSGTTCTVVDYDFTTPGSDSTK
ncbi:attachment p12 family protein [Rhodovulum bhavnagarense]|uniref:Attachment p12 family protein n=1 Tax=Rhodovulum bhavnagarense TaxID=992286 RepID=A0A4R2RFI7_9RHOB|nr:FeoB-associated Cys-rich membrane protein [Rhodovulum bhavnagarense]TCP58411.1 attachment p12 family protein [Rhodovulum bhavnagarense]